MKRFKSALILCIALFCCSLLCAESYFGTKAPTEPKAVGDIVFNDGSATPFAEGLELSKEQKDAAVALIFHVGTACSDDDANRTLGIGLRSGQAFLKWCDKKASAYMEYIDTIYETTKNGSQNLEKIGEWLREHGKVDDTATEKKYPAFHYSKKYGKQTKNMGIYTDGWYLPTKVELWTAFEQYDTLKAVCKVCKLPEISGLCWTSTQGNPKGNLLGWFALLHCFYGEDDGDDFAGFFNDISKPISYRVCAIREF
ncbi:MAG: hypothetical protein J5631_14125 [Spirochaetaceae bacterium]|nr:hypothetical protein [Spirochaetaceae bacterium]